MRKILVTQEERMWYSQYKRYFNNRHPREELSKKIKFKRTDYSQIGKSEDIKGLEKIPTDVYHIIFGFLGNKKLNKSMKGRYYIKDDIKQLYELSYPINQEYYIKEFLLHSRKSIAKSNRDKKKMLYYDKIKGVYGYDYDKIIQLTYIN